MIYRKKHEPMIYVLRAGEYLKIGHTKCLQQRMHFMMVDISRPSSISADAKFTPLFSRAGTVSEEREFHSAAGEYRVEGTREWYKPNILGSQLFKSMGFTRYQPIHLDDEDVTTMAARTMQSMRKNRRGGRPRTATDRCPCGKSSMARGRARCFACCHRSGIMPEIIDAVRAAQKETK